MKTQHLALLAFLSIALPGCRSTDSAPEDLPMLAEIEIVTPTEAADLAASEITSQNVDAEYERLVAELNAEEP